MLKRVPLLIILLIFLGIKPAISQLLFYDDCENKWLVDTDWKVSNADKGDNYATVSSEQARAGSHSYKLHVQAFDKNEMSATNCGLVLRGLNSKVQIKNFTFDREFWMGFSIYIPSSYSWPLSSNRLSDGQSEWQLLWQFHGVQDSCDTPALNPVARAHLNSVSKQGYVVSITGDNGQCITKDYARSVRYDTPAFSKGTWHDVVLNFKFSYTSKGFFRVWLNGKQVVNDSGMNCYNQSKSPYFIMGPYGHMEKEISIYYDEIRVGDQNSSYAEVAPKGSPQPSSGTVSLEPPSLEIISAK